MDQRDDFFSELFDDNSAQQKALRAASQLAFEERVIKRAFTDGGKKPTSWGRLANLCRSATNEVKLNFMWFNAEFRRFPATLCGRRVPYLHELTFNDLLRPNEKNRLVRAISKALGKQEIDETQKFIFAFPVTKTLFTAHNLEHLPPPAFSAELRFHIQGRPLIIESAKTAFARIGSDWVAD